MDLVLKIADVVFKGIAAGAGIVIVIIAQKFQASMTTVTLQNQASMTAATLQNQREQADSSLRANMLRDLIGPIVGNQKEKGDLLIDREQLLVELLALNFHESFALKPLMMSIDKRLASEEKSVEGYPQERNTEKSWNQRKQLRATAQLVVQRQLALLTKSTEDAQPTEQTESQTCIYRIELSKTATDKPLTTSPSQPCFSERVSLFDGLIEVISPNGIYSLLFLVSPENWEDESFRVGISIDNKKAHKPLRNPTALAGIASTALAGSTNVEFLLTWFDFPFMDNTLLADGTRFSVIIDQVNKKDQRAVLKLIWFSKDYFSLRERPINYSEVRSRLGLGLR